MTKEEKLLDAIKATVAADMQKEVNALRRKLAKMSVQRDEWKYRATLYRQRLLKGDHDGQGQRTQAN